VSVAAWWILGALATARVLYPRVLEWRHARRFNVTGDGIVVGAETIDLPRAGAPAVLLMHGGGDTPQSMRGLATFLHDRGYAVRAPLLEGHGRSLAFVVGFSAGAWRSQARAELDALSAKHEWVAVVGQSVGGALGIDLAATHPRVRALVLLAPWIAIPAFLLFLARISPAWGWAFPYLPSLGGHSIHDRVARSRALTHGLVTPAQLRALAELANLADDALPSVTAPTLTIQSREDERIAADAAQRAFDRLGAKDKRLEWTTGAGHVISVDYGKEHVFALAADWLDGHRGP